MQRYRLTVVAAQFFEGASTTAIREFSAENDVAAIREAEHPSRPLRFVLPNSDGTCASFPRKLEELRGMLRYRPVRTVKEWDA